MIKPTSGQVTLGGRDVTGQAPHVLVESGLVRTFQATTVFAAQTVRENLLRGAFREIYPGLLATLLGTAAARATRARADEHVDGGDAVARPRRASPTRWRATCPTASRRCWAWASALAARPRLIMLDEPAAGLSAEETDHVRDTIRLVRERGISVVVIDHNMRFITDLCDRVLVMAQGTRAGTGQAAGRAAQRSR